MIHSVRLVAIACWFLAVACSSPNEETPGSPITDESAIVRGWLDRGADPAVVAIDIDGRGLCTGTLIAPDVVLTARHCVAYTVHEVSCPPSSAQVGSTRPASTLSILVGNDAQHARRRAYGRSVIAPSVNTLCDADIAIIVLDQNIDDIVPMKVSGSMVKKGDALRTVGFGRTGDGGRAGAKRVREHVRILEATASEFVVGESTCQGDSGGPAIDEASGEVVGVVSRGSRCNGSDARNTYTRVDAFRGLIRSARRHSRAT